MGAALGGNYGSLREAIQGGKQLATGARRMHATHMPGGDRLLFCGMCSRFQHDEVVYEYRMEYWHLPLTAPVADPTELIGWVSGDGLVGYLEREGPQRWVLREPDGGEPLGAFADKAAALAFIRKHGR